MAERAAAPSVDPIFELICQLLSAARGAPEEGVYTASLRLAHAARRLAELHPDGGALSRLAQSIAEDANRAYFSSPEDYLALLDRVVADAAELARARCGLPPSSAAGDAAAQVG